MMTSETATLFGGINVDNIGTGDKKEDILDSIVKPFNKAVSKLLTKFKDINDENGHILAAITLINVGKKIDPVVIIRKSYKHITEEKTRIALLEKNLDFFREKDYSYIIKKDNWENTINFIISYLRRQISYLNSDELSEIWKLIWVLLLSCEYYKQYIEDYIEK